MADYQFISETGVVVADVSTTRQQVVDEYCAIFGEDFVTDSATINGQLIDAETTSRQSVARNNAMLANQINPHLAEGVFLDALMALTGSKRASATRSTVRTTITGRPNSIIPAKSQSVTQNGDRFQLVNTVVIPKTGQLDNVLFESVEEGPILAPSHQLNKIQDSVIGWETITNPEPAVVGHDQESDAHCRLRRKRTLGLIGRSVSESITSAINNLAGVRSMSFRENTTNTEQVIDGVTLSPHSIWSCVDGGNDHDIAMAILLNKTAGSNWNGQQSVSVQDPFSGQNYTVKFDRPQSLPIMVRITVQKYSAIVDPVKTIKDILMNYASGLMDGEEGFVVGGYVSPFEIASAINSEEPGLFVIKAEVAHQAADPLYSTDTLSVSINSVATLSENNITVIVQ